MKILKEKEDGRKRGKERSIECCTNFFFFRINKHKSNFVARIFPKKSSLCSNLWLLNPQDLLIGKKPACDKTNYLFIRVNMKFKLLADIVLLFI